MAAQFTATKGRAARRLAPCSARASTSLPLPVSPSISTWMPRSTSRRACASSDCIAGSSPAMPSSGGSRSTPGTAVLRSVAAVRRATRGASSEAWYSPPSGSSTVWAKGMADALAPRRQIASSGMRSSSATPVPTGWAANSRRALLFAPTTVPASSSASISSPATSTRPKALPSRSTQWPRKWRRKSASSIMRA